VARVATVLSVFVASPADVRDARKRLERVVDELNYVWSREYGLRLELVRWETHAYSDIGTDAQNVINEQLNEFDIFLGIMWKRFGEPTGRAESGTQEEFQRARRRYEQDPKRVRIMFYFKDAPPARLSKVDPKQLESVTKFRDEVAQSGVLHFSYKTTNEFAELVQKHLARQVQEWGKTWGGMVDPSVRGPSQDQMQEGTEAGDPQADESATRSITEIVFEELGRTERLRQRAAFEPEVMQRSFLEAQLILDSSPIADDWGCLAAEQATALVAVALASRLVESTVTRAFVARVCERIMSLRGLRIEWGAKGQKQLDELLRAAKDRHDEDVLLWIRQHSRGS